MDDYISREAVLSKCADIWDNADETTQTGVDTINAIDKITDFIESLPAADVQIVVHAQWVKVHPIQNNDGGAYMCTHCRGGDFDIHGTEAFCERCGARMDLKDGDTNV